MPPLPSFKTGDIVRWKSFLEGVDFYYGMVLTCEELSEIGHMDYPYHSYDELTGIDYSTFQARKITLFSFYEQKVVIVNQSDADVPAFPELVAPFEEIEIEKIKKTLDKS
jgi:hypothetical protein